MGLHMRLQMGAVCGRHYLASAFHTLHRMGRMMRSGAATYTVTIRQANDPTNPEAITGFLNREAATAWWQFYRKEEPTAFVTLIPDYPLMPEFIP